MGPPHQCERIGGGYKHSPIVGKMWGTCPPKSRQFSHFLVFDQGRWQNPQLKSAGQALSEMVHGKGHTVDSPTGQKFRGFGRWPQQMVQRQRGLYNGQRIVPLPGKENGRKKHSAPGGHVCLPWKSPTPQICGKVPSLASPGGRCPTVPPRQNRLLLCKPPLVGNWKMAAQIKGKPQVNLHDDNALLGFSTMVAPTNQTASQGEPSLSNPPLSGDVQQLLGRINAGSQMAPDLHNLVREGLQAKQVSVEAANSYLKDLKSLPRYNRAFKLFWAFCTLKNVSATTATLTEVASLLLQFEKVMPTQGRCAYAALLLVPGLEQLQFNPLLRQQKRKWNSSQTRYVSFYNAKDPIARLAVLAFNWRSIEQVRLRLLLCCRFFMLCRNVDLERMFRKLSFVGDKPFVLMQRKGCLRPQWEAMLTIQYVPSLCPWTLLKRYVALTAKHVPVGSPVFISLKGPPFVPLKANSIGSITKQSLQKLGVNTTFL